MKHFCKRRSKSAMGVGFHRMRAGRGMGGADNTGRLVGIVSTNSKREIRVYTTSGENIARVWA